MHIITRKRLNEFAEEHPDIKIALTKWYQDMKREDFNSILNYVKYFLRLTKLAN